MPRLSRIGRDRAEEATDERVVEPPVPTDAFDTFMAGDAGGNGSRDWLLST